MSAFDLSNEVAIITGGGTGLGFGIAQCMTQVGARVVLTGRRENVLQEAVESLGESASYLVHDVKQLDQAPVLVEKVTETVGEPTILINNAGVHQKKFAVDTSEEEFLSMIQTHVMGSFALARAVAPSMVEKGHGSIVFISSIAAFVGIPQIVAYSAAKSALRGMIMTLAAEWSGKGVRVNGIVPGWIDTPMTQVSIGKDPPRKQKVLSRTPMGRLGEPEDIGWAAVYLSSPAAKFVTGIMLFVDGGGSIGF